MEQVSLMTQSQLEKLIQTAIEKAKDAGIFNHTPANSDKHYVYGLAGIRKLFNVSIATAQHYKNTFLAPAVIQRGRKLMIDVEKAKELFNERRAI